MVRPVLISGSEAWTLRRWEQERLERTEMRMLRWILGLTLRDRKRNDDTRRILGVACVTDNNNNNNNIRRRRLSAELTSQLQVIQ